MHYPIRRSRPPLPPNTEEIIQANTNPKQGWRSTKHALRTYVSVEKLQNKRQWSSFYQILACIYKRAAFILSGSIFNRKLSNNPYSMSKKSPFLEFKTYYKVFDLLIFSTTLSKDLFISKTSGDLEKCLV